MNPTDPDDREDEGRAPPPPPVPDAKPAFQHSVRPPPPRESIWVSLLKALGVMALGALVLFGLLLGTCFLLVHK